MNPSVLIIGAGAAGLMAAKELSRGFSVTLLEAAPWPGGRIRTISLEATNIEAGAEFIHGNLPVTLAVLKEAGLKFVQTTGEMYRHRNGHFLNVDEMTEGWDGLLEKMAAVEEDITMQALLDQYYDAPGYGALRRHVKSYVEGFDLADIKRASVKALYNEWKSEQAELYRIPAGYRSLLDYLQHKVMSAGGKLHTGVIINKVDWQQGKVTAHASDGTRYTADKLLVTVPVSILQQPGSEAFIHFEPPLHFDVHKAGEIGYGSVIKAVIRFRKSFWQKDAGFILSDEFFPTWWTQLPDESPVLTGWLGGPRAESISGEPDEVIVEKALRSLAAIYDRPVAEMKEAVEWAKIFDWKKEEFAMGAYSYSTIKTSAARQLIAAPLEGTLFFAGEALYTGPHPGTVEAAFVSGINAAALIKEAVNNL